MKEFKLYEPIWVDGKGAFQKDLAQPIPHGPNKKNDKDELIHFGHFYSYESDYARLSPTNKLVPK